LKSCWSAWVKMRSLSTVAPGVLTKGGAAGRRSNKLRDLPSEVVGREAGAGRDGVLISKLTV
jgi:hypothetical protein